MNINLRKATIALSILGLLVAIYMTIYKFTKNDEMCVGSGDCHTVNFSKYADINGVPVAAVGVLGYAAILAIHWLEEKNDFFKENGTMILFGVTLIGFFFTLWLVYVEVALLDAYCPFCITSQISMTIIFVLTLIRVIKSS